MSETVTLHHINVHSLLRRLYEAERAFVQTGILALLKERPGRIISTLEIATEIYGSAKMQADPLECVRLAIWKLRQDGHAIVTNNYRGYSYQEQA